MQLLAVMLKVASENSLYCSPHLRLRVIRATSVIINLFYD